MKNFGYLIIFQLIQLQQFQELASFMNHIESFRMLWTGNFCNSPNWKIKKISEFFQFEKFQQLANFRIVHSIWYSTPVAFLLILIFALWPLYISTFFNFQIRNLIFKSEVSQYININKWPNSWMKNVYQRIQVFEQ